MDSPHQRLEMEENVTVAVENVRPVMNHLIYPRYKLILTLSNHVRPNENSGEQRIA